MMDKAIARHKIWSAASFLFGVPFKALDSPGAGLRLIMCGKKAADLVLVNFNSEGMGNLLGGSGTAAAGIARVELKDCLDQFSVRTFWATIKERA